MKKKDEQQDVLLKVILNKIIKNHWTEQSTVPQVSNFLGEVLLTEFLGYNFVVGVHQNANHSHFLLIDKTIKEIQMDVSSGKKEIKPKIVFTIKFGRGKKMTSFRSGSTTSVIMLNNDMKHEFFEVFIELQRILNQLN